jgi:hypothetical protein
MVVQKTMSFKIEFKKAFLDLFVVSTFGQGRRRKLP